MVELLKTSFEPLIKLFESKTRRIIFAVILLIILASIVADSLDGTIDSTLTVPLGNLGCGGAALFLGVGLLCILPNGALPHMRRQWYVFAIFGTVGGAITLLPLVISLVKMISTLFNAVVLVLLS